MFNLKHAFYGLIMVSMLLISCEKESVESDLAASARDSSDKLAIVLDDAPPINFCALAVGQQAKYLRFKGYQYGAPDSHDNYEYSEDTLVIEIVAETESGFLVEEYYTPGSSILEDPDYWESFWPDSTIQYHLWLSNDTIHLSGPDGSNYYSRIFQQRDYLPLTLFTENAEIIGWKTSFPYSESYHDATVPSWDLFGHTYVNLRLMVDDSFMATDGPGYTFAYHPSDGLVRAVIYSWWTQEGVGHDKLPD